MPEGSPQSFFRAEVPPRPLSPSIIDRIAFSSDLMLGAFNAIQVCLKLRPDEHITLLAGEECMEVAAALVNQVKEVGASFSLITLESCCARPCKALPPALFTFLRRSQVSIFAAAALPGELPMRMQLTRFVNEHGLRHAHMVNITPQIMKEGMQADFFEVDALSTRLIERARR
ncbi:MAG TPA: aminopeptidase, partial [Calditrichia bacterium]|nr:aminopeptidase [Calditrichia bacterium]